MSFSTVKWRAVTPLQDGIGKALLMMWTIPLVLGFETALANNAAGLDGSKRRQAETFLPIHEWYPSACCMDIDCGPISARGVRKTPLGWHLLDTGEIDGFARAWIWSSIAAYMNSGCRIVRPDACLFRDQGFKKRRPKNWASIPNHAVGQGSQIRILSGE